MVFPQRHPMEGLVDGSLSSHRDCSIYSHPLQIRTPFEELEMKKITTLSLMMVIVTSALCQAQVGGNSVYGQAGAKARAEQAERNKHLLAKEDLPFSSTSTFVEANILMNVKADAYVTVLGIAHEGETLAECNRKMEATVKAVADELKPLGIGPEAYSVDFVAQNKVYGFQVQGDTAQEKLVGFEVKKNISVRYQKASQLEKITLAAAKAQVYDLIKVDYVVTDMDGIQARLAEEAALVVKKKITRYEKLLGIKLLPPAQILVERPATHYPTQLYDSYVAFESEEIHPDRQKFTIRSARKSRTFYFNGLDGNGFDAVVNPVITEPVVQFTLFLKVKYEVEQPKAK
jgi:uncharacterized protein YggE